MVLSTNEESLISLVRGLPPVEAGRVLDWAHELSDLAAGRAIDWSDDWSDADLADAAIAAMRHFEDQERDNP